MLTEREKIAHLLRRFGLGVSENELSYYLAPDYSAAVELLLNYEAVPEVFTLKPDVIRPDAKKPLPMPAVVTWWAARMIATQRPLQEKMTLFWHDHFATSAGKVKNAYMMLAQNETFREGATGNFRDLLRKASQEPAMLLWLDNQENVKGKANENFAREVMELFTIGIDGGYSEKDVTEAARAFTGWAFRRQSGASGGPQFTFRPALHDTGQKTVLGLTGYLNGADVLNHLCDLPQCSRYITEKIIRYFVTTTPSADYVSRMAAVFRAENLEIKPLLRAIMMSPEFLETKTIRSVVKSPADFCIATARQLGYSERVRKVLMNAEISDSERRRGLAPAYQATTAMKSMGMSLLYPPDVSGWDGAEAWISSATMVQRIGWSEKLFAGQKRAPRAAAAGSPFLIGDGLTDSGELADRMSAIFDAPPSPARKRIMQAAADTEMKKTGMAGAAVTVTRLIFASPDFQFC